MNKKIIKAVLTKKHNDFVKSIDDPEVQKLVDKNSIITGGAIVSLLLNEKPKDFDYYFTDKETCIAVAKYYINKFTKLHPKTEIKPYIEVEDDRVKIIIKSAGIASESQAEGYKYFENYPMEMGEDYVNDVVQPIQSATELIETADEIDAKRLEELQKHPYRPIFFTGNAITLSNKVQLIIRFYGSPETIHSNYDFVHCTNYWTSKDNKIVLNLPALESLLSKQLFYMGSKYPLCSIIRTRKFIKRGWHINAGQYVKMCFQLSQLDLTDVKVLEDQLIGVDNAYFVQVIQYLRKRQEEDKEFKVETPYLISIIDKIF